MKLGGWVPELNSRDNDLMCRLFQTFIMGPLFDNNSNNTQTTTMPTTKKKKINKDGVPNIFSL